MSRLLCLNAYIGLRGRSSLEFRIVTLGHGVGFRGLGFRGLGV